MPYRKKYINIEQGKKPKWLKETYLKTPGIIFCPDWYNLNEKYKNPSDDDNRNNNKLIKDNLPLKKEWPKMKMII